MRYAIFVLLLLAFGCTEQTADTGTVADTVPSNDSAGAMDEPDDSGHTMENDSADSMDSAPSRANPTNPVWGSECEDAYDCEPYNALNICVMGRCEKAECLFRSDCKEKDHCFDGKCYLESELYAEFPECGVSEGCNQSCSGCESGKRRCMVTGWSDGDDGKDYYICAECNSDYDCSDGFKCVQKYCIKGPN